MLIEAHVEVNEPRLIYIIGRGCKQENLAGISSKNYNMYFNIRLYSIIVVMMPPLIEYHKANEPRLMYLAGRG
jgi:hypothetical protein